MACKYSSDAIAPSTEVYPLQAGDIEPLNRADALRKLVGEPIDYPHCPLCHRALLATDTEFMCPNNHYVVSRLRPMHWLAALIARIWRTAEA